MSLPLSNQRGSVLVLAFLAMLLLSALALSLGTISLSAWETASRDEDAGLAVYVARAGLAQSCQTTLLPNSDWSTIGIGVLSTAVPFGAGDYDVRVNAAAPNTLSLQVDARVDDAVTSLEFQLQRLTSAGGGSGATTGVKILAVRNLVLEATFG